MKRKHTLAVALVCSFTLFSTLLPGGVVLADGHEHDAVGDYLYDEEGHWKACGVEGCTEMVGFEAHNGSACPLCGYTPSSDDSNHSHSDDSSESDSDSGRDSGGSVSSTEPKGIVLAETSIFSPEYNIKEKEDSSVIHLQLEAQIMNLNNKNEKTDKAYKLSKLGINPSSVNMSEVNEIITDNTVDLSKYANSFDNLANAVSDVVELSNEKNKIENTIKDTVIAEPISIYTKDPMPINNTIINELSKSESTVVLVCQKDDSLLAVSMDPAILKTVQLKPGQIEGPLGLREGIINGTINTKSDNTESDNTESVNVKADGTFQGRLQEHYINLRAVLQGSATIQLTGWLIRII